MKNEAMSELHTLVGDWKLTMTDAWFLESREIEIHGSAKFEWLGDAFLVMQSELGGEPAWDYVIGRSEDPDFHQRVVARVEQDRISARADASEDGGQTWRKDLQLIFERVR